MHLWKVRAWFYRQVGDVRRNFRNIWNVRLNSYFMVSVCNNSFRLDYTALSALPPHLFWFHHQETANSILIMLTAACCNAVRCADILSVRTESRFNEFCHQFLECPSQIKVGSLVIIRSDEWSRHCTVRNVRLVNLTDRKFNWLSSKKTCQDW